MLKLKKKKTKKLDWVRLWKNLENGPFFFFRFGYNFL
ncbi:hypothetical protein PUN28_020489 [Cardiocondyla obscurior]|uniref:Ribosomal protein L32 n=1 Tax=Cardiocondyla obscurior TaxID=286306 RepID=A0AAW2E4E6_9HYME